MKIFKLISEKVRNNNPPDNDGSTPLHNFACNGNLDLCKYVTNIVEKKNPKDKNGKTPLHLAAAIGHLDICELILECTLENRNKYHNQDCCEGGEGDSRHGAREHISIIVC